MAADAKDPTGPIREEAALLPGAEEGASCTQASFKVGGKAFLYVGPQGGRFKAMFKLRESAGEAAALASREPDRYEVGKTAWVTARFTAAEPMPRALWKKWLAESYGLSAGGKLAKKKAAARSRKGKSGAGS